MTSTAQISANRENAQRSCGPRSDEGKARVSRNAFKHGLSSTHVVLKGEDRLEFQRLRAENRVDLAPVRSMQEALCDQISYAEWKLLRIAKWETEIIDASLAGRSAPCMALFGDSPAKALERLHRYEGQVRRGMHQDLRTLGRLQKDDFTNAPLNARRRRIIHNILETFELWKQSQAGPAVDQTNPIASTPSDSAPADASFGTL